MPRGLPWVPRDRAFCHPRWNMQNLCESCLHMRRIESGKGSTFLRCGLSDEDSRFPRYPPLPVKECAGFRRASAR